MRFSQLKYAAIFLCLEGSFTNPCAVICKRCLFYNTSHHHWRDVIIISRGNPKSWNAFTVIIKISLSFIALFLNFCLFVCLFVLENEISWMLFIQCEKRTKLAMTRVCPILAKVWLNLGSLPIIIGPFYKQTIVFNYIYIVNGRWRKLQVGSKEQQTSHSQRFLILFLLFLWWYMREVVVLPSRLLSLSLIVTSHSDV